LVACTISALRLQIVTESVRRPTPPTVQGVPGHFSPTDGSSSAIDSDNGQINLTVRHDHNVADVLLSAAQSYIPQSAQITARPEASRRGGRAHPAATRRDQPSDRRRV